MVLGLALDIESEQDSGLACPGTKHPNSGQWYIWQDSFSVHSIMLSDSGTTVIKLPQEISHYEML